MWWLSLLPTPTRPSARPTASTPMRSWAMFGVRCPGSIRGPVPSSPAIPTPPPTAATVPPRPRGLRVTALVATLGVVVALIGLAQSARPLATPTQDCGTALTFLAGGRVDEFVDPADPPAGVSRAEAEANNAEPCQERAAARALPAGIAVVGGTALGLLAVGIEGLVRLRLGRARRRRWLAGLPPG